MGTYSKLIAGAIGLIVLFLNQVFGIGDGETLLGMEQDTVVMAIGSVLTLFGIERVANKPKAE